MAIFGTENTNTKVVKADKAILEVMGTTCIGLNVTITFQRTVEMVPAISKDRILSIGLPQGVAQISTLLISGEGDLTRILSDEGCSANQVVKIKMQNGCDAADKTITCKGCVINAVSLTAQGGRGFIAEGVNITFTSLDI